MEKIAKGDETQIIRQLLASIEENSSVSQRQLSDDLDIALGSVNWYLKRCVKKGFIKIKQVPLRRYAYYLTPQGFEEKSRLTAQYLKWSLEFFRKGREHSVKVLSDCERDGIQNLILAGDSDLAEIFLLSSAEFLVKIQAIYDPQNESRSRLKTPIYQNLEDVKNLYSEADNFKFVLTDLTHPKKMLDNLLSIGWKQEDIYIPEFLGLKVVKSGASK